MIIQNIFPHFYTFVEQKLGQNEKNCNTTRRNNLIYSV